jgi:hypothetical protein
MHGNITMKPICLIYANKKKRVPETSLAGSIFISAAACCHHVPFQLPALSVID